MGKYFSLFSFLFLSTSPIFLPTLFRYLCPLSLALLSLVPTPILSFISNPCKWLAKEEAKSYKSKKNEKVHMRSFLALSESYTSGCLPYELWAQPTVLGWLVLLWTWRVSARRLHIVQGGRRSCIDWTEGLKGSILDYRQGGSPLASFSMWLVRRNIQRRNRFSESCDDKAQVWRVFNSFQVNPFQKKSLVILKVIALYS